MAENPIFTASAGNSKVLAFQNRFEVHTRKMSTLWLTKRRESYPYSSVRDVQVSGGTIRIHFGPLSVRAYPIGRKHAARLQDLILASK